MVGEMYITPIKYVLPRTSNARFNGYLKEIADFDSIKHSDLSNSIGVERTLKNQKEITRKTLDYMNKILNG
jgi:hypothetical protein